MQLYVGGNHESEKLIAIDKYSNIATALAVTKGAAFYRNTQEKISRKENTSQPKRPGLMSTVLMDSQLIMDS